jgi:ubiquinone/menaquinone biosynthesis C-methylase UbiE
MNGHVERGVFPRLANLLYSLGAIREQRARIVPEAQGVVLEIGIGAGLNLPFYDPQRVERVIGVEPDAEIVARGKRRFASSRVPVEVIEASAEALPLEDATVDTVMLTYSVGAIANIGKALSEMRRVLKPDGHLIFCEHGRSHDRHVARLQDRLDRYWGRLTNGCHLNRDLVVLLDEAGFRIQTLDTFYALRRPKILGFHYTGQAVIA